MRCGCSRQKCYASAGSATGTGTGSGTGTGTGISVSALECIDFGLWFLEAAGQWQREEGETEKGLLQQRREMGFCRWLFCILIACRAEKYATKLTLPTAVRHFELAHPQHLWLSLSHCHLHFATGQRHSKFASNFVCLLRPQQRQMCAR